MDCLNAIRVRIKEVSEVKVTALIMKDVGWFERSWVAM